MKIKQLIVVLKFEVDNDILLTLGKNIKELMGDKNISVQKLNIPQISPASSPRLLIQDKNMLIHVCADRYEYNINFFDKPKSLDEAFNQIKSSIENYSKFLELSNYVWCGIISIFTCPFIEGNNLNIASNKILNFKTSKELKNLSVKYGYSDENFNYNFIVKKYSKFDAAVKIPIELKNNINSAYININELLEKNNIKPIEEGIQITVDINNKVSSNKESYKEDISNIEKAITDSVYKIPNMLNLEGVVVCQN